MRNELVMAGYDHIDRSAVMSDLARIDPRLELESLRNAQWQEQLREMIHELQNAANDLAFALQAHFAYGKREV